MNDDWTRLMRVQEASKVLGIKPKTLYGMLERGEARGHKIGTTGAYWYIRLCDLLIPNIPTQEPESMEAPPPPCIDVDVEIQQLTDELLGKSA